MSTQQQQQNYYPTPQQQQFYQLQQQQQQGGGGQAAPGTPDGMNSSWNSYAAPMGIDQPQQLQGNNNNNNGISYQGNYGGMGNGMQRASSAMSNSSMGEMPYSSSNGGQQMQQDEQLMQLNLNPTAQPFVSGTVFQAPTFNDGGLRREQSMDSNGSRAGTPTTPMTPGGTKRRNNPYASAVASTSVSPQDPIATVSPVGASISPTGQYHQMQQGMYQQNSNGSANGSPAGGMHGGSQDWGSFGQGANFHSTASPVAAPLPTSLPQREGNLRGHRGRGGSNSQNYAGPHQGNNNSRGGGGNGGGETPNQGQPVTHDDVLAQSGSYVELARTANGSSFIQAAVREGSDPQNLQAIWTELSPCLSDLFLDAHGCYVIKSVMERLPPAQLNDAVAVMSNDPQLVFSMCTHSLHTRRVVQFLLDSMDCPFIFTLLTTHCAEIAMTQQGCIVMQRAMDTSSGQAKLDLYNAIYANLLRFCTDPFANYVVQHMLEVGDKAANSAVFRHSFLAHVIQLSCNKFASNVMEKALFHLDEQLQHELLVGIYDAGEDILYRMLQDSFGNYLIQSSIALAQYKDVFFISEKLRPVLQRTPYGHKIEGRLDRRLKGKAVGTRSPMIGATFKANQGPSGSGSNSSGSQQGSSRGSRGGSAGYNNRRQSGNQQLGSSVDSFSGASDDGAEVPW